MKTPPHATITVPTEPTAASPELAKNPENAKQKSKGGKGKAKDSKKPPTPPRSPPTPHDGSYSEAFESESHSVDKEKENPIIGN